MSDQEPPVPPTGEGLPDGGELLQPAADQLPVQPDGQAVNTLQAAQAREANLATLTAPTIEELLADPVISEFAEQMETANKEGVFMVADEAAQAYMLRNVVSQLPPDQQEAARMVITTVNFGKVPKTPGQRPLFINLSLVHQRISRMLIANMLNEEDSGSETKESRGFSKLEQLELKAGIAMANATDDIYIEWESRNHAITDPAERIQRGFTSKWHVVEESDEGDGEKTYAEKPYKEIWPKQYGEIDKALEELNAELYTMYHRCQTTNRDPETGTSADMLYTKMSFYIRLREAYAEADKSKLPEVWLSVDKAFVHQDGDLRSVHPMEDGYGVNETGVIPEQSMRYFLPDHPANAAILESKREILERFPALLAGNEKSTHDLDLVKRVDARIAHYVIRSGLEIVFKIAGHNIPNEKSVRNHDGINAFIDPGTVAQRLEESKPLVREFFGQEIDDPLKVNEWATDIDDLLKEMSTDDALTEVAVHEMGHNIGNRDPFKENRSMVNAIEEWKATAATFALQSSKNSEELTDEHLRSTFTAFLCQFFRYAQRREEGSQKPYYGADKFFIKTAQDQGLIMGGDVGGENEKWILDLSREKLLGFANAVKDQWLELQQIYSSEDQSAIDAFTAKNIVDTDFSKAVEKFVDRP
ncbi:MAG: hypothetical protein WCT53_01590 [Candidatus Gracilibacteria bacterium]